MEEDSISPGFSKDDFSVRRALIDSSDIDEAGTLARYFQNACDLTGDGCEALQNASSDGPSRYFSAALDLLEAEVAGQEVADTLLENASEVKSLYRTLSRVESRDRVDRQDDENARYFDQAVEAYQDLAATLEEEMQGIADPSV